MRRQEGIATALVLWMTGGLMLLTAAMALTTRTQSKLTSLQQHTIIGQALAEAASNLALREIMSPQGLSEHSPLKPYQQSFDIHGQEVVVIASSASGLVNLNAAGEELLTALFERAGGLTSDAATTLAHRVIDWRDGDQAKLPQGAEDEDYVAAGRANGARDGEFLAIEDLQQVLGFHPELVDRISGLVTVWGNSGSVNPAHAPPELLEILYANRLSAVLPTLQTMDAHSAPPAFDGNLPAPETSISSVIRMTCLVKHPDGVVTRYVRWVDTASRSASGLPWLNLKIEPPTHSKPSEQRSHANQH